MFRFEPGDRPALSVRVRCDPWPMPSASRAGAARWAIRWVAAMGIWLLLTDTVVHQELLAGAIVAAVVATAASIVERPRTERLRFPTAAAVLQPLWRLVPDTCSLGALVAMRLLRGRPFAGRLQVEQPAGPGLIGEWWDSLAPGRYVIGVDEGSGLALVHELPAGDET
jgi:hypothetical protein